MLKEAEVKLTEISNDQCLLENTLTQCSDWDLEDIYKLLKPNDDLQRYISVHTVYIYKSYSQFGF